MAEPAPSVVKPGLTRAQRSKLKKTRAEAKDFLRETRRLTKRYGKRLAQDKLAQVQDAVAAVEALLPGEDVERLGGALKRLDALVEKHLGFARRSPGVEYTISIAKALAIALVLRLFVVEAFKIPSGSMIPTLLIGDHLFVNKLSYGVRLPVLNYNLAHWGGYRRGEIIVFAFPGDDARPFLERRDYIKRIIGLPGDVIEVKDETIFVNGVAQQRVETQSEFPYYDRLGDDGPWIAVTGELWKETLSNSGSESVTHDVLRSPEASHAAYQGPYKVPEGHLFMMGDNRDNSQDGRANGGWFVPFGHVKGRALIIWLSWGLPGHWLWGEGGLRFDRFFTPVH